MSFKTIAEPHCQKLFKLLHGWDLCGLILQRDDGSIEYCDTPIHTEAIADLCPIPDPLGPPSGLSAESPDGDFLASHEGSLLK